MSSPLFESPNLIVSEFSVTDSSFIFELLNTSAWKKFIGDRNINNIEDAANYIHTAPLASYAKYGYGGWKISLKRTGEPIGMVGLFRRDYLDGPDLGFALLPGFEGKGFAYESSLATLNYVSETYNIQKLYATTVEINPRSQRLLARLGFVASGNISPPGTDFNLLLYTLDVK